MNTYTIQIEGMTCHACESLITMDLEDGGLPGPESISAESGQMNITLEDDQLKNVKQAIEASEKYTVLSIERV